MKTTSTRQDKSEMKNLCAIILALAISAIAFIPKALALDITLVEGELGRILPLLRQVDDVRAEGLHITVYEQFRDEEHGNKLYIAISSYDEAPGTKLYVFEKGTWLTYQRWTGLPMRAGRTDFFECLVLSEALKTDAFEMCRIRANLHEGFLVGCDSFKRQQERPHK